MKVDEPRHHGLPGGINDLCAIMGQPLADARDLAVLDQNILKAGRFSAGIGPVDDLRVFDDKRHMFPDVDPHIILSYVPAKDTRPPS